MDTFRMVHIDYLAKQNDKAQLFEELCKDFIAQVQRRRLQPNMELEASEVERLHERHENFRAAVDPCTAFQAISDILMKFALIPGDILHRTLDSAFLRCIFVSGRLGIHQDLLCAHAESMLRRMSPHFGAFQIQKPGIERLIKNGAKATVSELMRRVLICPVGLEANIKSTVLRPTDSSWGSACPHTVNHTGQLRLSLRQAGPAIIIQLGPAGDVANAGSLNELIDFTDELSLPLIPKKVNAGQSNVRYTLCGWTITTNPHTGIAQYSQGSRSHG